MSSNVPIGVLVGALAAPAESYSLFIVLAIVMLVVIDQDQEKHRKK